MDEASGNSVAPKSTEDYDKLYAARVIERLDRQHKFVEEQVATNSRWLTASLLAVNGDGAIAVVNVAKQIGAQPLAGLMFVLGVGAALLSGNALQDIYNGYTPHLLEMDNYWTRVKAGFARDLDQEAEMKNSVAQAGQWNWIAPGLGWVSGLLFLTGAIVLGVSLSRRIVG